MSIFMKHFNLVNYVKLFCKLTKLKSRTYYILQLKRFINNRKYFILC